MGCSLNHFRQIGLSQTYCASAHRGLHTSFNENTPEAVHEAVSHSLVYVEIDVRQTLDGQLVLFHDGHIGVENLVSSKKLIGSSIESKSYEELQKAHLPDPPFSVIPLLNTAFSEVKGSKVILQLDIKHSNQELIKKVVTAALKEDVIKNVAILCYDLNCLTSARDVSKKVTVLFRAKFLNEVDPALAYHPGIVQVDAELLTREFAEKVRSKGSRVQVKAIGEKDNWETWKHLFDSGADIILTDNPVELQINNAGQKYGECSPLSMH